MRKYYFFLNETPVDPTLATNKREAWMPKNGEGYFDHSARRYFNTKLEKRAWLSRHGMREAGELYNPSKSIGGTEGNVRRRR